LIQSREEFNMATYKRKKLLIDPKVQGLLIVRVAVYWLASMLTIEFLGLTWAILTGPEQATFAGYFLAHDWRAVGGRMLLAALILVPIVWDMLAFSNRFAGPVFRMRRVLRTVAQGGPIEHVRLRSGDYWHGFADDLNAALERLSTHRPGDELPASATTRVESLEDDFSPVR
jgi:hypothetical protein